MAVAVDAAAEVAAVVAVAVTPVLEVAVTPGLEVAAATSGLEVAPVSGLEVAAASGSSLDAEVAARSEVAAGSEVAGAAAADSCSVTTGTMTTGTMTTGTVEPAADPGEHAACAKSHDLGYGTSPTAIPPDTETAPLTDAVPSAHHAWIGPLRLALTGATRSGTAGGDCLLAGNAGSRSTDQGHVVAAEEP